VETPILQSDLAKLPHRPGVYLMLDDTGKILYVGAAKDLKKRVSSYFRRDISDIKTRKLVANIKTFDYEIHDSREAAFIRERDLIRIHHPRYNIDWKDDKDYPLVQITVPSETEKFSRLFIVRSTLNAHDWFFGRKKDVTALRSSVRVLRRIFPIANKTYCFRTKKPCLDYSIKRCSAPCVGKISLKDYQKIVNELVLFLQGKRRDLLDLLYTEMNNQAENLDFEGAAKIRDRISQIERTVATQKSLTIQRDKDIVTLISVDNFYLLLNFWIQNNEIINIEERNWGKLSSLTEVEIVRSYIQNFYLDSDFIPQIIESSIDLGEDQETLEIWLSKRQGNTIELNYIPNIEKNKLINPIILKKKFKLGEQVRKEKKKLEIKKIALNELKSRLKLNEVPNRIETYDISNLQGKLPVGSMVVFSEGLPQKSQYRKFKIKTLPSEPNDVAMMIEVLRRRLEHTDEKFAKELPDLIVIDGGKPQVNAIGKVITSYDMEIPVIGLAKREEEVFLPQKKKPVPFPNDSPALRLLKQTRDEAHRFAITYHKKRRVLQQKSGLDNIPGVGAKRRKNLLKHFGSIEKIRTASVEELCQVEGISRSIGEKIFINFHADPENNK
jgi:excinuclease ABC subunit C